MNQKFLMWMVRESQGIGHTLRFNVSLHCVCKNCGWLHSDWEAGRFFQYLADHPCNPSARLTFLEPRSDA